jgi:Phosphotransferase System HPr (HPr) Family
MKSFNYVIRDEVGMHARPAGMLVKEVGKYVSEIKVGLGNKEADAKRLFSLMQLGIKHGDEVTITITGDDEEIASQELEQFFKKNL